MAKVKLLHILCVLLLMICSTSGREILAQDKSEGAIHIDIPVKLEKVNAVFNMGHASFTGDMPTGMRYMHLLANRLKETGGSGSIIGVFYGDATYMVLNDKAYNTYRRVTTGNPYKETIATLLNENVKIEVCANAMKTFQWTNQDLLPGVKVNAGAIGRLIQLAQEGYVQIQP